MYLKTLNKTCLLLFLLLFGKATSQQVENIYQQELNKMVSIPNSPEAQAFISYGDIDVSLYTGTPNIVLPLHVFRGRELDLPISLTYDASGIKVEQLSTWAGLGWNLNVGGRISRVPNGLPDDYINGNYLSTNDGNVTNRQDLITKIGSYLANTQKQFATEQDVRDYYLFLDNVNKNFIDAQPDIYNVTAPGLNTTIVFDIDDGNIPKSLENPRIRVDNVIRGTRGNGEVIGWVITNEDGTKYTFGAINSSSSTPKNYETTKRYGNDNTSNGIINNEYVSSWLLTKIESSNRKDIFEFEYFDSGFWDQPLLGSSAIKATVPLRPFENYYTINEVTEQFGGGAGYWISQQFVSSIKHNNHQITSMNRGIRNDIPYQANINSRLSSIEIFDYSDVLIKKIVLQNEFYFNNNASSYLDKRLKLNGLQIKDSNDLVMENYQFDYDRPDLLPSRSHMGQDFAGFYNGENNTVLFERFEMDGIVFEGADRNPNGNMAKIGMLKKITYPTGGYKEFEFEGNLVEVDVNNEIDVYDLQLSLYPNSPLNESFYLNNDGSYPDDKYLPDIPKTVFKKFNIGQTGFHEINLYGSAPDNDIEAYIFKVDGNFTGGTFSEYMTNPIFWNSYIKTSGINFNFDSGLYVAVLLMDELGGGGNQYGNITFTVSHKEDVTTSQNLDKGGLRINTIKSYDSDNNFSKGKKYTYLNQKENYRPYLSEIKEYAGHQSLVRTVSYPQGDQPAVVYPKIRELQIDGSGNSEGYVDYEFYDETKGQKPFHLPPYENNFFPSIKGGTIKRNEAYDVTGNKVSSMDKEYFETLDRPIKVNGMTVFYDDDDIGDYVYIKAFDTYFKAENLEGNSCDEGVESPTYGVKFCNPIPACANNFPCSGYVGMMDVNFGGLNFRETFVNGAYGGISVSKDTLFLKDKVGNPSQISNLIETTYEDTIGGFYRPIETKSIDSKGNIYKSTFTYPGSEHPELLNRNRLLEIVASKNEKVDNNGNVEEFISAAKNEYYVSADAIQTSKVFTSKEGLNSFDERINFSYYSNGNIKESQWVNGPKTTYVWGYDNMYPVAIIENASITDINGINYDSTVLQDITSSDADKRIELDKIRNGLLNSFVKSYTYNLGIGLTSMTDPSGYTIYYEYDEFNRLKEVKDESSNLLKDYQYHYKGQN